MNPATPQSKSLLSQHYLDTRLSQHPEWAEDPAAVWAAVAGRWEHARQFAATWNEAQTEDEFVKPLLAALGWSYIVQTKTRRGNLGRPDYTLFGGEASKNEAYSHQHNEDAFYGRALAIAEAKYWGRPLSQKTADGRDTWKSGSNPSHQMVSYLNGTRCTWGLLTNGRVWRLYSREASSTASEYYEFDLGALFDPVPAGAPPTPGQLEQFKRWWLFFRRTAFVPDAQGKTFVQRAYNGSATYAREISDKLKELVFREVMPEIAGGFVAFRHHQLGVQTETDEDLRLIYQASLSLLYKLLFLLYAEARGLLPVSNAGYREQSVTQLAQWAADRIDARAPLSDATFATARYDGLLALFHRLDQGDPSLDIPRYDGGLFHAATTENRFLGTHKLSDRAVARAVDTLVRDAGEPVDYAYISVRNLGAIYEGLLENKLRVLDAAAGRVELVNDKGERKATGSYYTPDYIVEYIVRHTLDPLLEERGLRFTAAMDRCAELRKQLGHPHLTAGQAQFLRPQLDEAERDAREAFLGIKVCDPAMGSGHFLVNAVDHLTDAIIQRMQAYHDAHPAVPWDWNPIQRLVDGVRGDIVAEMAQQGIAIDPARLDDTALLTRLVMKRCIYGVDLNLMAVELAKLSLWLHSFTVGAPLSFLDHHLRWGNSLIGAGVRMVEAAIQGEGSGQLGLFAGPFAGLLDLTSVMIEIAGRSDATLADVRRSAAEFKSYQAALTPYKQVLDLWVSQYFGNRHAREFLTLHAADALDALQGARQVAPPYEAAIAQARALWEEKRFFHWDLEFPEVFIDLVRRDWAENPGFDAMIGNPPWGAKENLLSSEDYRYLGRLRVDNLNYYPYFVAIGMEFLCPTGQFAMVLPDSLLTKQYPKTRKFLLENFKLQELVHLTRPFPDVDHDAIVLRASKESGESAMVVSRVVPFRSTDIQGTSSRLIRQSAWYDEKVEFRFNLLLDDALEDLSAKLYSVSVKFESICKIHEGIHTRHRRADIFPENVQLLTPLHHPVLIGERSGDIVDRYFIEWGGRYVNYDASLCTPNEKGMTPDLVNPDWFERTKLVIVRTGEIFGTALDYERFYLSNNLFSAFYRPNSAAEVSYCYLCSLLNSTLLQKFLRTRLAPRFGNLYIETKITHLDQLPIRRIDFTTSSDDRARYSEKGRRLYEQFCAKEDFACVLGFVDHELSQQPKRSDVVHDLLSFLAGQMIDMNKQKQAEMKGFLAWLEREIGVPIDSLANKSKVQNYLGDYQKDEPALAFDGLLAVLRQNSRKLAVDPGGRSFQERLQVEYEASLGRLLPLKTRLARTDRLIDRVVYRLYGLTEEEIAIVEGR